MIAMFDGRCTVCDEKIVADVDDVVRDQDDNGWCHVECEGEA